MCLVGTDIVQVTPHTNFRILITSVGKHPKALTTRQTVSVAGEHPVALIACPITHGEVLGVAV